MTEKEPLHSIIGRVRRAMPRNADVMAICDAAERSMSLDALSRVMDVPAAISHGMASTMKNSRRAKFSRKAK